MARGDTRALSPPEDTHVISTSQHVVAVTARDGFTTTRAKCAHVSNNIIRVGFQTTCRPFSIGDALPISVAAKIDCYPPPITGHGRNTRENSARFPLSRERHGSSRCPGRYTVSCQRRHTDGPPTPTVPAPQSFVVVSSEWTH